MNRSDYQRVIREMCLHTGIEDWQEIAELQHVVVDHITVGLMYNDEEENPPAMFLYFDFGPPDIPELYQKLLEINAERQTENEGSFGCHAQMSAIVYRVQIQLLSENPGIELADKIQHFLHLGRSRLDTVLSTIVRDVPQTGDVRLSRAAIR